jgi:S1-C subfamily serine protease
MKHAMRSVLLFSFLCVGCAAPESAVGPAGAESPGTAAKGQQKFAAIDFRQVVKPAMDKVFPAVVYIRCLREDMSTGKKVTETVGGSGVILSETGQVATNWHVVDKAVEVRCLLSDGRHMNAKVLGSDEDTDLALLQLDVPKGSGPLPRAVLGDSDRMKEGDLVMAMGAPWGLERSVTMGIISCTRRYLSSKSEYSLWLQTDAPINPGNSGGPLVNAQGEVVGINTRGIQGGDTGFSIPAHTVQEVVSQIRQYGKVNWSWTGLQLQPLRDFQKNMYLDGNEGVIVGGTDPESPARSAGILTDDRIVKIGGKTVAAITEENLPAVRMELGLLPKQKPVDIELLRGGKTVVVPLTPREKGKVEGEELEISRWDLTVKTINQFDNPSLFFHRQKGVFVYGVKRPGNAERANLQTQDIILKIDDKEILTLDDLKAAHKAALAGLPAKHQVLFTVLRNGLMTQASMDYSRDYEKE